MKGIMATAVLLLISILSHSQTTLKFRIISAEDNGAIANANITSVDKKITSISDSAGNVSIVVSTIPIEFEISHVGFKTKTVKIELPSVSEMEIELERDEEEEEEEEIVIQSTRSTRTIKDIPTRVEFIAGEELDEKANMKPGDIRMVLTESTGIQTQQTSATSANASIRIQGLDGRYTQILKDGFPLYAGFSGGLGLLQTPPLDLKQFEVIKGSASTLYGGGAIAGLVNLISKTPTDERELRFHVDVTSAGGLNTSAFFGEKFNKTGLTVFASRNSNAAYDPSDLGLTAIPKFERYTLNPKFFLYPGDKTNVMIGVNLMTEERIGGDIDFIKKKKDEGFVERNESDRISTQLSVDHRFGKNQQFSFKNSYSYFKRSIELPGYYFEGFQHGTFTEATYAVHNEKHEWVVGANLVSDKFSELKITPTPLRNYTQTTAGLFLQDNWKVNEKVSLEMGLRGDYVFDYGFAFLPRINALFKLSPKITSRVGGGLGYKAPNIFTEDAERLYFRGILPVNDESDKLERSYGVNADINYKTTLANGDVSFSLNHLFFYTRINSPLLLKSDGFNFRFQTVNGHIDTKGMETNIKIGYSDFKLFVGYTFTSAYLHEDDVKTKNFLTPQHRINSVLLYEVEEKWKVGLEGYFFSKQLLSDGSTGKSYWITGLMVEKLWEKFSVYINFENFLDSRQTRFDSIYTGTISNPQFRDIYAPVDGFVVNGGIKLRL